MYEWSRSPLLYVVHPISHTTTKNILYESNNNTKPTSI